MASQAKDFHVKEESFEDFEFVDRDGDLNVDMKEFSTGGEISAILSVEGYDREIDYKSGVGPIFIDPAKGIFSSSTSQIFSTLCSIIEEEGMVVTIPIKAVATTAATAVTGSLIAGVPGLAVGLLTGAVIAYRTSPNRNKSPNSQSTRTTLRQVFNQMTLQQKKDLLKDLLACLKQSSVRCLVYEILKNEEIRNMALSILSSFLMKKMGVRLCKVPK